MRMPSSRPMLALSAAIGAVAAAHPALAQDARTYEYAQPASEAPVVFRSEPMVQSLALPASPTEATPYIAEPIEAPMPPVPPMAPPPPYIESGYASRDAYPPSHAYSAPYAPHGYVAPVRFDRDAWLDDCRDRIRGVDRKDRAGVIGGLLGALAGGVIGNRSWDSHRPQGPCWVPGWAVLPAWRSARRSVPQTSRHHDDECAYLPRPLHESSGVEAGYREYGLPWIRLPGYGYGYTMVPVLVMVPQRQVVRETVTEEWVEEPVRERAVTRTRVIRPAAHRDKRLKYTK